MKSVNFLLPIISVVVLYLERMREMGTKRERVAGPVQEKSTFYLFMLAGILMLAGSVAEYLWRGQMLRWKTFLLGWICALSSLAIRRWAIHTLGSFWSLHVEIRATHPFIQSGPFRWVRHPTYLSMILELVGCGLILNARYAFILSFAVFVPALGLRLKMEEAALVAKFGEAYRTYQRRTPLLFPYRWPVQ